MQMPESPRWLMLSGRTNEAKKAYERIARMNNVKLDEKFDRDFYQLCLKCKNDGDKKEQDRYLRMCEYFLCFVRYTFLKNEYSHILAGTTVQIYRKNKLTRNFHSIYICSNSSWSHWFSLFSSSEYRLRLLMLIPPWFAVGMSSYGIHFSVR